MKIEKDLPELIEFTEDEINVVECNIEIDPNKQIISLMISLQRVNNRLDNIEHKLSQIMPEVS